MSLSDAELDRIAADTRWHAADAATIKALVAQAREANAATAREAVLREALQEIALTCTCRPEITSDDKPPHPDAQRMWELLSSIESDVADALTGSSPAAELLLAKSALVDEMEAKGDINDALAAWNRYQDAKEKHDAR